MHIDPKAPATSPRHPRNWRQPLFLAPGSRTLDDTPPAVASKPPAEPATPPAPAKPADTKSGRPVRKGKRLTHKADLAEALAELEQM